MRGRGEGLEKVMWPIAVAVRGVGALWWVGIRWIWEWVVRWGRWGGGEGGGEGDRGGDEGGVGLVE